MIVEFVGLPASGKTTLAKEIYKISNVNGRKVRYPLYELYRKSWLSRNLLKLFGVLMFVILNPIRAISLVSMIVNSDQSRFLDYFRLIFNNLYIFYIIKKFKSCDDYILLDEGIFHHGWAVQINAKKRFDIEGYIKIFNVEKQKVIHVKCDLKLITERMIARRKLNSRHQNIKKNIYEYEKSMMRTIDVLDDESILILRNENVIDINNNINTIINYLSLN